MQNSLQKNIRIIKMTEAEKKLWKWM